MKNRMVFGCLITLIGLVFSLFSFIYVTVNPCIYNGIDGFLGSLLGNDMLLPFIISTAVMIVGLVLCYKEAYRKS